MLKPRENPPKEGSKKNIQKKEGNRRVIAYNIKNYKQGGAERRK
jgi:hypothetical protein